MTKKIVFVLLIVLLLLVFAGCEEDTTHAGRVGVFHGQERTILYTKDYGIVTFVVYSGGGGSRHLVLNMDWWARLFEVN